MDTTTAATSHLPEHLTRTAQGAPTLRPPTGRPRQGARMGNAHTAAIAGRIRQARLLRGLTQGDLAARIGVTFQQVQKYEHGGNCVTAGGLVEIARALDLPVSFFLDDCGEAGRVTAALPPEDCTRAALALSRLPAAIRDRIGWLIDGLAAAYRPAAAE